MQVEVQLVITYLYDIIYQLPWYIYIYLLYIYISISKLQCAITYITWYNHCYMDLISQLRGLITLDIDKLAYIYIYMYQLHMHTVPREREREGKKQLHPQTCKFQSIFSIICVYLRNAYVYCISRKRKNEHGYIPEPSKVPPDLYIFKQFLLVPSGYFT